MIYYIQQIFSTLWRIIKGVFFLGWRLKEQEDKEKEHEISHYFKQVSRKEMASWQIREQVRAKKMMDRIWWLPKNFKKKSVGWLYHNYFYSVLLVPRPDETPERMVGRYWKNCVGPYYMVQAELIKQLREDLKDLRHELFGLGELAILDRMLHKMDALPDLHGTATTVMDAHKEITMRLRKEAEKLKEDRKKALDERDKAMLDLDEKVLQSKLDRTRTNLEGLRTAKKGVMKEKNPT